MRCRAGLDWRKPVPGGVIMSWSNLLHKLHKLRAVSAALVTAGALAALSPAWAQDQQPQQAQQQERLSDQQLQQLVAPIALYPDPMLAQILIASNYTLELVMTSHWYKAK